jgi:hypothetical protein
MGLKRGPISLLLKQFRRVFPPRPFSCIPYVSSTAQIDQTQLPSVRLQDSARLNQDGQINSSTTAILVSAPIRRQMMHRWTVTLRISRRVCFIRCWNSPKTKFAGSFCGADFCIFRNHRNERLELQPQLVANAIKNLEDQEQKENLKRFGTCISRSIAAL